MPIRKMHCDWPTLDAPYRRWMARLGLFVGSHPLPFLIIPVIVSMALVYPFLVGIGDYRRLAITRAGSIALFTPSHSRSGNDRQRFMEAFPDGGYFRDRTVVSPGLFVVLVSAQARNDSDESISPKSILDDLVVNEYRNLRGAIENLPANTEDGREISIRSLCLTNQSINSPSSITGRCQPDAFLTLWTLHRSGLLPTFTYPYVKFDTPPSSDAELLERVIIPSSMYIGPLFGGVRTDDHGNVKYVKYVRMIFRLPITDDGDVAVIDRLATSFSAYLDQYRSDTLSISYWVSQKYARDMQLISKRVVKLLPALIILLLTFALVSCCMKDCVLSKPWLAVGGLVSAGLGLQVGFALLFLIGIDLIEIAMIVPFLVLSIGLDDTFVMLNVWRSTDPKLSVQKRMATVFEEAAVSITITSVTDVAAFLIGVWSVFPAVRIFCAFCASALFAVFVYQLTFFGACMTYAGRMEADGRHCITFRKVIKEMEADKETLLKKLFCATSTGMTLPSNSEDAYYRRPWPVIFFKNHFAQWLHRPKVKLAVGISYIFYIATSVFFLVAYLRQGLQVSNLVPYDSSTHDYLTLYERYFSKCSTSAEVLILASNPHECGGDRSRANRMATIDYERRDVQRMLVDWALSFENTDFTYKIDFWLYQYVMYRQKRADHGKEEEQEDEEMEPSQAELSEYDTDLEENFVPKLENEFLSQNRYRKYIDHVTFDRCASGGRYVNASRFYVELANMGFENRSSAMRLLREKADGAPQGFTAFVYDVSFPLAEQYDAVLPGVLYDVGVGVGCMLVVACLFVPNMVTCACIAFTVFSINIGVLGYIAVWNVNLDIISTITILLSIGFSVDYTSHVAYHFYVSGGGHEGVSIESKVAEALETAGWPILQSSLSMMVGVVTVLGVRAYISDTFVKTVLLVMLIGVYHALIVLPVLLSVVTISPNANKSPTPTVPSLLIGSKRRRGPPLSSSLASTLTGHKHTPESTSISTSSICAKIGVDEIYRLPAIKIPMPPRQEQCWSRQNGSRSMERSTDTERSERGKVRKGNCAAHKPRRTDRY